MRNMTSEIRVEKEEYTTQNKAGYRLPAFNME